MTVAMAGDWGLAKLTGTPISSNQCWASRMLAFGGGTPFSLGAAATSAKKSVIFALFNAVANIIGTKQFSLLVGIKQRVSSRRDNWNSSTVAQDVFLCDGGCCIQRRSSQSGGSLLDTRGSKRQGLWEAQGDGKQTKSGQHGTCTAVCRGKCVAGMEWILLLAVLFRLW